jgi:formylglycine-generating enzyme required for sulfatase activity
LICQEQQRFRNENNVADIFLSYAREDLAKARLLATGLEQQGWSVFWDRTSIQIGQDFDEVIEEAIEQARCMIVGWSQASKRSDWVRGEATIGRERRILLPVLFEAVSPPIAFRSLHTEDFSNWRGEPDNAEFLNLCKALTRLAGNSQQNSAQISSAIPFADITPSPKNARLPFEPDMVEISPGSFQMGGNKDDNERPIHTVTFAKPFKLSKYPVTFAEYDVFAEKTGRDKPDDKGWGRERRPVINVSWQDAVDYAAWLGKITGKAYRLPSEAEWEYACRAGSTTEYFWGYDESKAAEYAWFSKCYDGHQTHPVGKKKPNPRGLYDMEGNVWEWLQDTWHNNYRGAPDNGSTWGGSSSGRVLRGGSWGNSTSFLRSAHRNGGSADSRDSNIGFRLAQD